MKRMDYKADGEKHRRYDRGLHKRVMVQWHNFVRLE